MKLITFRLFVLLCAVYLVLSMGTSTKTQTNTNAKTKTESKMSIFSYDFLSVMKKKMQLRNSKAKSDSKIQDTFVSTKTDSSADKTPVPDESDTLSQTSGPVVAPQQKEDDTPPSPKANPDKGPIFFSGWMKYFKFNEHVTTGQKPNSFFKNNEYDHLMKTNPGLDTTMKSSDGIYKYCPDPSFFFVSLFKNQLTISASRKDNSRRIFESLNIETLQNVLEAPGFLGGIQDFGSFSEGYCMKLLTQDFKTWILCSDNSRDKIQLMDLIKSMKLKCQRDKGDIVTPTSQVNDVDSVTKFIIGDDGRRDVKLNRTDFNVRAKDGSWILLQDWSQCSKKCDTGISTLHRLCIPPQNGGKNCDGQAVLTKSCNLQPCPVVNGSDGNLNNAVAKGLKGTTLKPIIKVMPLTSRPKKVKMCIIKEDDLMMTKEVENKNPFMPDAKHVDQTLVRAILNNRTISFYENAEDFSTQYVSYNLKTAYFAKSPRDKNCFIISESKKKTELCGMGMEKPGKAYEEWDRDFHLFKYNCETPPDVIEPILKKKMEEKLKDAKDQMLLEREKLVKDQLRQKDDDHSAVVLRNTNQFAQEAVLKEDTMEEMIQKEEEEKELKEEIEINMEIENEKKKQDCVLHAIKERELENQYQMKNKETEQEVNDIKKKAMAEVIAKREKLKVKIGEMRRKSKRNGDKLKQQLLSMRMSMAKEMSNSYKDGDKQKCVMAMNDDQSRINYCTANFNDYIKFSQCKGNDEFCVLCCENEYGEMHMDKRNACIKNLCEEKLKPLDGRRI